MKQLLLLFVFSVRFALNAQVICGTAGEGGVVTLTAPPGNTIVSIEFASYGTPDGACGSFTLDACHATTSQAICEAIFIGQATASVSATNDVFGDPCGGTVKWLYVQARYSSTLPLTLTSFTARQENDRRVQLQWTSEQEANTLHFSIERSADAITFAPVGSVAARGTGNNAYAYTDVLLNPAPVIFYRLKMVDIDKKYTYSQVVRVTIERTVALLTVYPNPVQDVLTVSSRQPAEAMFMNAYGQVVKRIQLKEGSQQIQMTGLAPGMYFLKIPGAVVKINHW